MPLMQSREHDVEPADGFPTLGPTTYECTNPECALKGEKEYVELKAVDTECPYTEETQAHSIE